jgi:hypothetical protein
MAVMEGGSMKTRHAASGSAIRAYISGKIDSKEYFRQVRESTMREVRKELAHPAPKTANSSSDS